MHTFITEKVAFTPSMMQDVTLHFAFLFKCETRYQIFDQPFYLCTDTCMFFKLALMHRMAVVFR